MCLAMAAVHISLGVTFYYVPETVAGVAPEGSTAGFACLILILTYVTFFEFSLGPVTWICMAEIMQSKALTVGVFINWFFTLAFALSTQYLVKYLGGAFFIILGGFCAGVS